jgi:K+/H+ antiporter YhaU regulatory subunit KhtT
MAEDGMTKLLMDNLIHIRDSQEDITDKLSDISQRLARLEEKTNGYNKLAADVEELKTEINKGLGVKDIVAWLIATGIAIASYIKSC